MTLHLMDWSVYDDSGGELFQVRPFTREIIRIYIEHGIHFPWAGYCWCWNEWKDEKDEEGRSKEWVAMMKMLFDNYK